MAKNEVINMRSRSIDVAIIDEAAKIEGKSRSAFIRDCAERAAIRVLGTTHQGADDAAQ
jgi:uncharacterized protein (DUF1778 family)